MASLLLQLASFFIPLVTWGFNHVDITKAAPKETGWTNALIVHTGCSLGTQGHTLAQSRLQVDDGDKEISAVE